MKNLIGIFLILFSINSAAQSSQAEPSDSDKVFTYVEQMPEFPGGNDKLQAYLKKNISYLSLAESKRIEGKVYVWFIVNRNGKIKDARIERSADPVLDEEALRVVNKMPDWKPGMQNGSQVSVSLIIPVLFMLEN